MYIVCYASNSLCVATTCFHKHSPGLINSGFMARLRVCARESRFWSVIGNKMKLSKTTSYLRVSGKKHFNFPTFSAFVPCKKLICDHSSLLCSIYDFLGGPLKCGVTNSKIKVFIS